MICRINGSHVRDVLFFVYSSDIEIEDNVVRTGPRESEGGGEGGIYIHLR